MASNSDPQKSPSEEEEEFLKRFSLRKFTVPSEKPKDFPNAFKGSNSDTLKECASPQKRYRIEYKKLSSVMKTVGPWWLQSRGLQEHMSSEVLVTLVEDTPKKIYGSQFPKANEQQIALSSYHKDKGASNAPHQIDIMFSARNYAETRSVNGFLKSNISHISKLRDVDYVEDRVGRLLSFLNNFGYERLRSGCEYCDKGQDGKNEKTQVSVLTGKSEFSDVASNLDLCICALEVIDAELEDVSRCLLSMMKDGQCNYQCSIKRLQALRRPLREVIMNVQCQAESTKQLQESEEKTNLVALSDASSSTRDVEKPNNKKTKFWCVPRRTTSEKNLGGDKPSKKSKKKSKKSDLDSENDSSPTREKKSKSKKVEKKQRFEEEDNPAQNKTDLDSDEDDSSPTREKESSKKSGKRSKATKPANKQSDQEGEQDDIARNQIKSKSKKVEIKRPLVEEDNPVPNQTLTEPNRPQPSSKTAESNLKTIKSTTSQNQIKEHNECSESDRGLKEISSECQSTDSEEDEEEEYYVANKHCQTDLQRQPIYVPFFVYDEGLPTQHRDEKRYGNQNRNQDLSEDCTIKICQDRRNHRSTRDCDPNARNRYQNQNRNQDLNDDCTIKICQDRRNHRSTTDCDPNARNRYQSRDEDCTIEVCQGRNRRSTKHCDSSGKNRYENRDKDCTIGICQYRSNCESRNKGANFGSNETNANAQEIRPCYCSQCRCRRNFSGGAEIVENDETEFVEKRRRRSSAKAKCSCGCGCSAFSNSSKCTKGVDEDDLGQSGRSSKGEVIETFRETSQRKEVIERDKDNILPVRKSVTIKKETEENYYYPAEEEKNFRRSSAIDESRNQCDMDDPQAPCSKRKSRRSSRKIRECELNQTGNTKQRGPVCQRRKSQVENNQDVGEQDNNYPVEERLSRTEIIEEKRIQRNNTEEGTLEEVESNHILKKKMSKIQITEDRSPFEMKINTDERRSIRKSLRPSEDMIEYEKEFNPKIKNRTSRTELVEERKSLSNRRNDEAMNADKYSSVEKRSSRYEITEDNRIPYKRKSNVESRRSIRKSLIPSDDMIQDEYDVDRQLKKRSSRTEIKEERTFLSNKRNDEPMNADDDDNDKYDSVQRRTSRVVITELNRPPSKRKSISEAPRSIRKSLIPSDDIIPAEDDLDTTLKKRSSRIDIVEERKFLSNKSNDERTNAMRRDSIRQSMLPNSDMDEYDSVQKRSSRVEITEYKRPSQKKSISNGCCSCCCKCKKTNKCVDDNKDDLDQSLKKRSSRTEIVEERAFLSNKRHNGEMNADDLEIDDYNSIEKRSSRTEIKEVFGPPSKRKSNVEVRRSIRKSLIPSDDTYNKRNDGAINFDDQNMGEYDSVQKRSSRTEIKEVYGPPSKRKSITEARHSIRKSLIPSEEIIENEYDVDSKLKKRSSRTEIVEERKFLSNKINDGQMHANERDLDEYDAIRKRTSRVLIMDVNRPPSSRKSISETRRSIRKSLIPVDDAIENDYDVNPALKKRTSRTEIVEERKFLSKNRSDERMNAVNRRFVGSLRPDSDMDFIESAQKRSSRVEIREEMPNQSYSVIEMSEERRSKRNFFKEDDDVEQPNQSGYPCTCKITADKSCGTDPCGERKLKTDCSCKCLLQDSNCVTTLYIKPKCQETQTIPVCRIEDDEGCSLSAMQTGGQLQAQLELKIQGGKCNRSEMELCKPTDCPARTFCCNCYGKNVPVIEKDIAKEIRILIRDRERNSVFLKFTIVDDLYHIQISTDDEYLGCLYATECAISEARNCNAFDGYITLSVTESWNSKSQIEKLVDHAFVVVRRENGSY